MPGSDVEPAYREPRSSPPTSPRDPLLGTARLLSRPGAPPDEVLARYEASRARVLTGPRRSPGAAAGHAAQVMAPLAPRHPDRVAAGAVPGR